MHPPSRESLHRWSQELIVPTLHGVAAVALAVLVGAIADGFVSGGSSVAASIAAAPVGERIAVPEFLAHAVAAQAGILVALAATLAFGRPGTSFTLRRHGILILAGTLGSLGLNAAGSWVMEALGERYRGLPEFAGPGWTLAVLLVAGIGAPMVEELFFREALLARVLAPAPRAYALVVSSIAFGAMHLPAGGLVLFLTMLSLGMVFGWLRLRAGSIGPAVAAHALNNLVALTGTWLSRG